MKSWLWVLAALTLATSSVSAFVATELLQRERDHKIDSLIEQSRLLSPADMGNARIDVRVFAINSQIAQASDPIVFIGDSIIEGALLPPSLDGHPVVNAGIGGATPKLYLDIMKGRGLLSGLRAHSVVIALGTNNAHDAFSESAFKLNYRSLIDEIRPKTGRIILAGVLPITDGSLSRYFNRDRVTGINATIRAIAKENGFQFIELSEVDTLDGVHPSADGYKAWAQLISSGLAAKIAPSLGRDVKG